MSRVLLTLLALLLVLVAGSMLYLGTYPPQPNAAQVERVLPNDTFKTK